MKKSIFNKTGMDQAAFVFLVLLFFLPGLLSLIVDVVPDSNWEKVPGADWLRNRTLVTEEGRKIPLFKWKNIFARQTRLDAAYVFDRKFPGREALVRLLNESYFRIFNETTFNDRFTFGKPGWVYETAYLQEYFIERQSPEDWAALVDQIVLLQQACRSRGKGFVFVLTPSKAALYPEKAPGRWARRYDTRPRAYNQLVEHLKEKGVIYLDGPAQALEQKTLFPEKRIFPPTGSHWSSQTSLSSTNSLIGIL